jgi:glutaminyl-peptide cyclotransferase
MQLNISSFNSDNAWNHLVDLASRGKRVPGTDDHSNAIMWLYETLDKNVDFTWLQEFTLNFQSKNIQCANICGVIRGKSKHRNTILIGSHFDTRLIADNERDPVLQRQPIPGVNDGTSGIAVILELARVLKEQRPVHDLVFVLFDAEDVGNIDGHEFGIGACQ